DDAELSPANPAAPDRVVDAGGLSVQYQFVRSGGASAYTSLESAGEGEADRELEGGWAVAVVEQRSVKGERWDRTSKGVWMAQRDLVPARPSLFRGGTSADGGLDFAWLLADRAPVWASASSKVKPKDVRVRFQTIRIREEQGAMV